MVRSNLRVRLLPLLLALSILCAAPRPARAESQRRWIAAGILYGLAAAATGLMIYGAYQVSSATDARTLGIYHATANRGEIEAGVGGAAMGLCTVAGTMAIIIGGAVDRKPRPRVALVPTLNGLAIGGSF